jgi:chemotaxis protein MotB
MIRRMIPIVSIASLLALGCGHSNEEWQSQLGRYDKLQSQCNVDAQRLESELAAARAHEADLTAKLHDAGIDLETHRTEVTKLSSTLDDRERALAEYRARAQKLEQIKARFDVLRKKLDELVRFGLVVSIRHNKMVISLPGDVLFDSGKDTLRKDGEEILRKVAAVIRGDRSLAERDYQVAGHTDDLPLKGGPFRDNWGLSLMRSRSVLTFLVGKAGNLPRRHWSAAGFAETDPVAANTTKDGKQKNRRCELIVMPDVDEMLDLQELAH